MLGQDENENDETQERLFSWRRVRTLLIGSVVAIIAGLVVVSFYIYFQYGANPVEAIFGGEQKKSEAAGKLAYDKGTKFFLGVIKGEGVSPRRGKVYYIERAGGQLIELPKERVEVREPGQSGQ